MMSLDDHAEDLASSFGVDKTEVKRDLENLVSYSVPLEEAKDSLRRKYGDGSGGGGGGPTTKSIADVTTGDSSVNVTAKVLTAGKRSIRYQGSDHVIHEGELADETGKISYTAWEDFALEPGETVTLGNVGVREWEGKPELNLGESTSASREDEDLEVPYDIGGEASLVELEPGDRGVTVEVTVTEVEEKIIDGRDGETEILSGVLADETGRLPFTDWDPHPELTEGASVRLGDLYVREFRGAPSVNVSEFSTVETLDRAVEVTDDAPRMSVRDAVTSGGLFDVELAGSVIEVRDGSGLIQRCPQCGRLVQNGQCRSHGAVEGVDDLRIKAVLDDGTGTVTAILDDEITERVYGGDVEDAKEHARDEMDQEAVADAIREEIVGREFVVRGSLSVDEYGANLNARSFVANEEDPATLASDLLAEVRP
jgi:replication factor A1